MAERYKTKIIRVELSEEEYAGLLAIAEAEIRTPENQMRRFLHEAMGIAPVVTIEPVEEFNDEESGSIVQ